MGPQYKCIIRPTGLVRCVSNFFVLFDMGTVLLARPAQVAAMRDQPATTENGTPLALPCSALRWGILLYCEGGLFRVKDGLP